MHNYNDGLLLLLTHVPMANFQDSFLSGVMGVSWVTMGVGVLLAVLALLGAVGTLVQYRRYVRARDRSTEYQAMIKNATDGILITTNGHILYANPAMVRMVGHTPQTLIGLHANEIIHKDQVPQMNQWRAQRLQGEVYPTRIELTLVGADGREVYTELNGYDIQYQGQLATLAVVRDITHRKEAENQLRHSADFLQMVINTVPFPLFVKDRQHRYLIVNEALCTIQGKAAAEIVGKGDHDIMAAERANHLVNLGEQLFASGNLHQTEITLVSTTGEQHHMLRQARSGRLSDGQEVQLGCLVEITDRKVLEDQLRDTAEFLNFILDAIPDPLFVKDEEHRLIKVNDAFCKLGGLSADEYLGTTDYDNFPKEQADQFFQIERQLFTDGLSYRDEEQYIDRQDQSLVFLVNKTAHQLPSGQKILIGRILDITERKRMELELRDSAQFLDAVINTISDPLFVKDRNHRIVKANQAYSEYVGRTAQELIGLRASDVMSPERASYHEQQDEAVFISQKAHAGEVAFVDHGGTQRYWLMKKNLLNLPSGQQMLTVTGLDVTSHRAAEEELRTAKEAAELANRAKSTFLSTMTHELRTPMNGVLGMASLLRDTPLSEEQLALVETIRTSGDAMLSVINQILDFSKIEAEKLELEPTAFNLRQMVEETLDLVAPQATEQGLTLAYFIDEATPARLVQDVGRLRQILTNLAGNAVKFTGAGEVIITVSSKQRVEACELHFAVADTGIGIPPDRIDTLFNSFSQVDASITRRFGGTGLGLAISKRLCEAMGGKMWVESTVDVGTTFHFTILATPVPAPAQHVLAEVAARSAESTYTQQVSDAGLGHLRGKKVLLLTASETTRRLIMQYTALWSVAVVADPSPINPSPTDPNPATPIIATVTDHWLAQVGAATDVDAVILDWAIAQPTKAALTTYVQQTSAPPLVILAPLGEFPLEAIESRRIVTVTKPIHMSALHDALVSVIAGHAPARPLVNRTNQPAVGLSTGSSLRILVAEDNLVNQRVALGFLAKLGHAADIVGNGLEVIEALARQAYDLIFMDVNMPEMDGLTATAAIRSRCDQAQPYIVAMTANAMVEDRKRCLDAGMDDYISKPLNLQELTAALERAMPRRHGPLDAAKALPADPHVP